MPIYDYYCAKCNGSFEKIVMKAMPQVVCPACGSKKVEQMVCAPALHNTSSKNDGLRREYQAYSKRWNENAYVPKPKKHSKDV